MNYLHLLGKFMISIGVGVLLFVAYTLWGTGFYENRQQDQLQEEFALLPVIPDDPTDERPPGPPNGWSPGPGDPVFELRIPAIDLNKVVVEGVGEEDLRKGPGHYPACRQGFERPWCTDFEETWPGDPDQRVVISGHRTTYGAPFWDLNKLERGDEIITNTKWGRFVYSVTETKIVEPDSQVIVIPGTTGEVVLTTCNPRYSAAERLIVFAELEPA